MLSQKNATKLARAYMSNDLADIPKTSFPMAQAYQPEASRRSFRIAYVHPGSTRTYVLAAIYVYDDGTIEVINDNRKNMLPVIKLLLDDPSSARLSDDPRGELRTAFQEITPDWPQWFVGIDFLNEGLDSAIVSYSFPDGTEEKTPVMTWRTKIDKAKFFKTMSPGDAANHHGGIVIPFGTPPEEVRRRLFDRIAPIRRHRIAIREHKRERA